MRAPARVDRSPSECDNGVIGNRRPLLNRLHAVLLRFSHKNRARLVEDVTVWGTPNPAGSRCPLHPRRERNGSTRASGKPAPSFSATRSPAPSAATPVQDALERYWREAVPDR